MVGNNAAVVPCQQYLCDHAGKTIPLRRGKDEYQIVFVDDDAVAITTRQWVIRLNNDDLEQAQRWVKEQGQGIEALLSGNTSQQQQS
jgi:hypothetical protein